MCIHFGVKSTPIRKSSMQNATSVSPRLPNLQLRLAVLPRLALLTANEVCLTETQRQAACRNEFNPIVYSVSLIKHNRRGGQCAAKASGVCRRCGRALCSDHLYMDLGRSPSIYSNLRPECNGKRPFKPSLRRPTMDRGPEAPRHVYAPHDGTDCLIAGHPKRAGAFCF